MRKVVKGVFQGTLLQIWGEAVRLTNLQIEFYCREATEKPPCKIRWVRRSVTLTQSETLEFRNLYLVSRGHSRMIHPRIHANPARARYSVAMLLGQA